jgi:hypothetical protein
MSGMPFPQHEQPVEAHAKGQAAPAGQSRAFEHLGMGEAALGHLDPLAV